MLRRVLGPLMRRWRWADVTVRVHERVSELHGTYLAAAVTLSAFVAIFPLLLVAIAVLGFVSANSSDLASDVISRLGLTGDAADTVTTALDRAEDSRQAATVIGLAGLLWSGLGLVAALQYAFDAVWQVAGRGMRDKVVGLLWLVGAALILVGSFALTSMLNFVPGPAMPLALLGGLAINVLLWLWSMRVLPNRNVGWRALLPGAILGGVGLEALKVLGAVFVPNMVTSSSGVYGTLGVVFAILAWLLLFGRLLIYASVLNVVLWEDHHGTVTAEIELPKVPGEVSVVATRAGEGIQKVS